MSKRNLCGIFAAATLKQAVGSKVVGIRLAAVKRPQVSLRAKGGSIGNAAKRIVRGDLAQSAREALATDDALPESAPRKPKAKPKRRPRSGMHPR